MISCSNVFFYSSHFSVTVNTLSVSSVQFLLSLFLHSSPTLSMSLSMQSPLHVRFSSPPFHLPFFLRDQPYTPQQFLLRTFSLQPPLSFHPFDLISSLNSHDYSYQVVFRKSGSSVVSLLVSSSLFPFSRGARGSKWTPRAIFCCPVVF